MAISRPIRLWAPLRQIAVALRIGSPLTIGLSIGSGPSQQSPACILKFAGGLFVWRKQSRKSRNTFPPYQRARPIGSPTHQLGQRVAHERYPMSDFIYDDQGKCVAWIVQGDVFSETTRQKIATIRDGNIFDFSGNLVGHLQDVGFVRKGGDSTPPEFTRLLS
jgi:hypothetical protein